MSCCNEVCIDVCFPNVDLVNDTITAYEIGSYQASGVSMSAIDLVTTVPLVEVRENHNGIKQLFATKKTAEIFWIEINQTAIVNNEPFIGGRPKGNGQTR